MVGGYAEINRRERLKFRENRHIISRLLIPSDGSTRKVRRDVIIAKPPPCAVLVCHFALEKKKKKKRAVAS